MVIIRNRPEFRSENSIKVVEVTIYYAISIGGINKERVLIEKEKLKSQIVNGDSYYHKSPSCKFLNDASTSAVDINNVSIKHSCN